MIEFEPGERPDSVTQTESNRRWREKNPDKVKAYRQTDSFKEARRIYRQSEKYRQKKKEYRKNANTEHYLNRQFIAWDGEGVTDNSSGKHYYNMLANSMGSSIFQKNYSGKYSGLGTERILQFLCEEGTKYADSIHIIYGGGYDFNMFLRDLEKDDVRELYDKDSIVWHGYSIKWRRGRSFEVRNLTVRGSKAIIVYDVLPFFQSSFVKACDSYLGDNFLHREVIVEQKAKRGTFQEEDFETISRYNQYELENLVHLATELRFRLDRVGIRIKRWDGPGAIAAELLSEYKVQDSMAESPEPVAEAARFAYSGGRFELIKCGVSDEPVYEYDINSAYPYALQFLPNLRRGYWKHSARRVLPPSDRSKFALYHAVYSEGSQHRSYEYDGIKQPRPLFKRVKDGSIFYPEHAEGWYWASEVFEAVQYIKRYPGRLQLLECWEFIEDDPTDRPFAFVPELYRKRQELKACGDGAHVGLKLGLNSMYGKLAQQIGWSIDGYSGQLRKPPFHQLEWAGFTTAMCRSLVLHAAVDCLDSVIAFETDALFTTRRLGHLAIGPDLGDWEETVFESLSYIQSGFYFATVGGEEIVRSRGVDKDSIDREGVEESFLTFGSYTARSSRFVTAGQALYQNWDEWATWQTDPREITAFTANTKRVHNDLTCRLCGQQPFAVLKLNSPDNQSLLRGWHDTFTGFKAHEHTAMNTEYPIEWLKDTGNSEIREDIEMERRMDYEQMSLFDENGAF